MLKLEITLHNKSPLISKESSSGFCKLYLELDGQRDKIFEQHFGTQDMTDKIILAVQELLENNKRI